MPKYVKKLKEIVHVMIISIIFTYSLKMCVIEHYTNNIHIYD